MLADVCSAKAINSRAQRAQTSAEPHAARSPGHAPFRKDVEMWTKTHLKISHPKTRKKLSCDSRFTHRIDAAAAAAAAVVVAEAEYTP